MGHNFVIGSGIALQVEIPQLGQTASLVTWPQIGQRGVL
jgi:hypothetical protein